MTYNFSPKIVQYSIVYKFCHVKIFYIKLFLFLQHVNFVEVNFVNYIFLLVFTVLNSLIVTLKLSFILTPPPDICTLLSHIPKKKDSWKRWSGARLVFLHAAGTCFPKREGKKRREFVFRKEKERNIISYLKWKGALVRESTAPSNPNGRP